MRHTAHHTGLDDRVVVPLEQIAGTDILEEVEHIHKVHVEHSDDPKHAREVVHVLTPDLFSMSMSLPPVMFATLLVGVVLEPVKFWVQLFFTNHSAFDNLLETQCIVAHHHAHDRRGHANEHAIPQRLHVAAKVERDGRHRGFSQHLGHVGHGHAHAHGERQFLVAEPGSDEHASADDDAALPDAEEDAPEQRKPVKLELHAKCEDGLADADPHEKEADAAMAALVQQAAAQQRQEHAGHRHGRQQCAVHGVGDGKALVVQHELLQRGHAVLDKVPAERDAAHENEQIEAVRR